MNRKVILTLTVLVIVYWFLFDFLRWELFDTPSFIGGARLMFGLEGGFDFQSRLTKPLVLVIPGMMELFTGLHPKYAFLFQNVICFYLCGIYVYKINQIIFKDDNKAFLGMLAYCTCQPFAIFSLFILSDVVGWFFGILGIYLTLKYFSRTNIKPGTALLLGMLIGLGCLAKESAVIGLIFLVSYLSLSDLILRKKAEYILFCFFGFAVPLTLSYLMIDYFYDDSIMKRVMSAHSSTSEDDFTLSNLKQLFRVIDMYWFIFLVGLAGMIKAIRTRTVTHITKSVLLAALLSFTLTLIWPYFLDRILFLMAPFLIIIAIHGISSFKEFGLPLILFGGLLNILISYVIYKHGAQGSIVIGMLAYLGIMAIITVYLKKKNTFS